jgi:hypothetical protein
LPDGKVGEISRQTVPMLRNNDFDGAMTLAVDEISQIIAQDAGVKLQPLTRWGAAQQQPHASAGQIIGGVVFLILVVIFLIWAGGSGLLGFLLGMFFGGGGRWGGGGGFGGFGGGGDFGGGGGGGGSGFGGFGGGSTGGGGAGRSCRPGVRIDSEFRGREAQMMRRGLWIALAVVAVIVLAGLLVFGSFVSAQKQMVAKQEAVRAQWSNVQAQCCSGGPT